MEINNPNLFGVFCLSTPGPTALHHGRMKMYSDVPSLYEDVHQVSGLHGRFIFTLKFLAETWCDPVEKQ